ncbi:ABC transporter substrate-binding protein [Roseomonas sp. E05]|uniref:ABC transporter substrate-binding protein n=1 Tax=Roseomonas sp. E05 TaxID=3046310 RepID=UPI0024BB531E|nr:ABC transporter substrate-binding protein [Roseomonas sp. E05]MDJ0391111.1 ABC transporter substrate-binding protein [Roseomonas sp. E05]
MDANRFSRRGVIAGGAGLALLGSLARPALAQGGGQGGGQGAARKLRIAVFGAPSLGAFLPPVIKERGLDAKQGLDIDFVERTPDAYATQFNTGEFQLGGSAAPLTIGLAEQRGIKPVYLLNLFDYWGAAVTNREAIRTLKDLEGQDLAAARGTTNYAMFAWFARRQGADPDKFRVVNTAPPGLVAYAMADRAAAVQLWEPAYTLLKARKPSIRMLDLGIAKNWQDFAGSAQIPYLGLAAHQEWVASNKPLVPKLHAMYREAAEWLLANPDEGARLAAGRGGADEQKALADLIRNNERLGLNVRMAGSIRKEIEAVYRAGQEVGLLPGLPSGATIHDGQES